MVRLITKLIVLPFIFFLSLQSQAKPVRFQFSGGDSKVEFEGTGKPSLLKIHGSSEQKIEGYFVFDGKKISGKAVFNLESLDTGIDLRNEHMKTRYLEVAKFPKAELEIKEIVL
jgi:polyisoprenoid-binding protein YceI